MNRRAFFGLLTAAAFAKPMVEADLSRELSELKVLLAESRGRLAVLRQQHERDKERLLRLKNLVDNVSTEFAKVQRDRLWIKA